jgi:predicted kinase
MKSLQLTKPHLIVIVGIPGSGKTFFAEQFSKTFNAPYLNYAELRAMVPDDAIADKIWEYVLGQLFLTKQTILVEGGGNTRNERQAYAAHARSHGYQILFIWVQTEPLTAQIRATKGVAGQKNTSFITDNEFNQATQRFQNIIASENYMVISGKHTYASQAKNVLKKLVQHRTDTTKLAPVSERPPRPGRVIIK